MLSYEELLREAAATGFQAEPLGKALRLLELLESLPRHPFLKERVVLKGGTALNLFIFNVPRLSVDIDLNYIGAVDRATMLAERPKIEQAIQAVCGRLGIQVQRVPAEHAGGKWRMSYERVSGGTGTLGCTGRKRILRPFPCSPRRCIRLRRCWRSYHHLNFTYHGIA